MLKKWIATLMIVGFFGGSGADAATLDNQTRVELQTEIRSYIARKIDSGIYTFFDEKSGETVPLRIKAIHPVVLSRGKRFLLCADFIDANGEDVVIDYVVLPTATGYLVEKEIEGQRPRMMTLFEKLM